MGINQSIQHIKLDAQPSIISIDASSKQSYGLNFLWNAMNACGEHDITVTITYDRNSININGVNFISKELPNETNRQTIDVDIYVKYKKVENKSNEQNITTFSTKFPVTISFGNTHMYKFKCCGKEKYLRVHQGK